MRKKFKMLQLSFKECCSCCLVWLHLKLPKMLELSTTILLVFFPFFASINAPVKTLNDEPKQSFSNSFCETQDFLGSMVDKVHQLFFSDTHEPPKTGKNTVCIKLVKRWIDKIDQCTGDTDFIGNKDHISMKMVSLFAMFFQ